MLETNSDKHYKLSINMYTMQIDWFRFFIQSERIDYYKGAILIPLIINRFWQNLKWTSTSWEPSRRMVDRREVLFYYSLHTSFVSIPWPRSWKVNAYQCLTYEKHGKYFPKKYIYINWTKYVAQTERYIMNHKSLCKCLIWCKKFEVIRNNRLLDKISHITNLGSWNIRFAHAYF